MEESQWTAPHPECLHPERWNAPDSTAAETEVSDFMAALCVLLRPQRVLETGAYLGHTTRAMGQALSGFGWLDALEIDPRRWSQAKAAAAGIPVRVHLADSLAFAPDGELDLVFIDSEIGIRYQEMVRFREFGSSRCVWVLHDAMHPLVVRSLEELQSNGIIASATRMPTPRGLAIGRYA